MPSNLPPGVRATDIPGNRPEDSKREQCEEWVLDALAHLTEDEVRRAVLMGIAALKAERFEIDTLIRKAVDEEQMVTGIEEKGWTKPLGPPS